MAHFKRKLMQLASLGMACLLTAAGAGAPAFRVSAENSFMLGDFDWDGALTIYDVNAMVDVLLRPELPYFAELDMNEDGLVNGKDLTLLKRAILYPPELPPAEEKAVMLVYACGSDLESGYGEFTDDLNEMLEKGVSDGLDIVIMTGGASEWQDDYADADANYYLTLTDQGLTSEKAGSKLQYMNDGSTLQGFIKYAAETHPADHYGLVMWDHGSGPMFGLCYDELSEKSLQLRDMCSALKNAGVHFDWIGFDCCLMGSAEIAFALRDYADYMIGSEESESGLGWNYSSFPMKWSLDPEMDTVTLAKSIIDDMTSENKHYNQVSTLACYDLQYAEPLMRCIENYIGAVYSKFQTDGIAQIISMREKVLDYGEGEFDMADVKSLVSVMDMNSGTEDAVFEAVDNLVIYNRTNKITGCGVTTWFFRNYPEDAYFMMNDAYEGLGFSSDYIYQFERMCAAALRAAGYNVQSVSEPRTVKEVFAALSAQHVHVEK